MCICKSGSEFLEEEWQTRGFGAGEIGVRLRGVHLVYTL